MTEEHKSRWQAIARVYGEEQLGLCAEECAELIQALNKYRRMRSGQPARGTINTARGDIIEEIADVLVTIEQVKYILGISEYELYGMMEYKLERTERRMRGEERIERQEEQRELSRSDGICSYKGDNRQGKACINACQVPEADSRTERV